jgi:hypothetical protein
MPQILGAIGAVKASSFASAAPGLDRTVSGTTAPCSIKRSNLAIPATSGGLQVIVGIRARSF